MIQWLEAEVPNGWTQATFPTSFKSWYKIVDSVTNIYTGTDAITSASCYTINTGRSTLSYVLYSAPGANSWFHPHFIVIGS